MCENDTRKILNQTSGKPESGSGFLFYAVFPGKERGRAKDGMMAPSKENKEEEKMVKTLDIEGMMCAHCQAHVQKALEGVEGVTQVAVSLEENNAVVSMEAEVEDKKLIDAVEAGGYKVVACKAG